MRTTVTQAPEVEAAIRHMMEERGLSFKEALNSAVRAGLNPGRPDFHTPTRSVGEPTVPLDRALALAGELGNAVIRRELSTGR
ncbi:hypothetical protein [Saccharomonospora cyanea]|uniref:Antitoxin n=1 Tax=Saccharomonospora cyanea NA-134 TaxID=882082 RepID=H5XNR9_9PSEU|nr:hypothetical protein [Saccharomonospora cyanea]EHR62126.1 hypothetical protein SaccyDRAFT_3291 [Saccharomonospora cyanea NA-134]